MPARQGPPGPERPANYETFETGQSKTESKTESKTDWAPQAKVAVGGVGAALAIVVLALGEALDVHMTEEVAIAVSYLLIFVIQYLVPNRKGE